MDSIYDAYSFTLMLVSMGLFIIRFIRQNPPVFPYLIIACTCYVGNVLGESGGGIFALALLVAASFSFLGCLLYPNWRNMGDMPGRPKAGADTEERRAEEAGAYGSGR